MTRLNYFLSMSALTSALLFSSTMVSSTIVSSTMVSSTAAAQEAEPNPDTELSTDDQARDLYLRGDRLYAEGRYEAAVEAFSESYELSGRPQLQFNLANAYERLGRYEEAIASLREYAPNAPEYDHDTITRRIRSLEQRLEEQEQQTSPTGGQEPGPNGGILEPSETSGGVSVGGVVLLSVGLATLVGATVFGILAGSANSDLDAMCPNGLCPSSAMDTVDREQTFALVADIGFIVGAVATLAGGTWMLAGSAE